MFTLSGYTTKEKLYESERSVVYRAVRSEDEMPLVFKLLKGEYPDYETTAQFNQEYKILKNLHLEGVIKTYGLEKYQHSSIIVLEDFGGEALQSAVLQKKQSILKILTLALNIAEALGQIHQEHIMHLDINPSNILWNPQTNQVKIIDFGISTKLSHELKSVQHPNVLKGTLAYMSPEQTGRMNRAIDYRTDLYSLGVTLYELLTGRLPFLTIDPMELVHCHLAILPTPPHELNRKIPPALSNMVLKLMAKAAEDRYQSTTGLAADIRLCRDRLIEKIFEPFVLGQNDISDHFQIPQKLYGREKEKMGLLTAFERVSQGSVELMLVAGYSGIGKSTLVQEIHKPIVEKRGYFISGKFDQFQKNVPYASLLQAFGELIHQILTESEERILQWKKKLLEALGGNGNILVDVMPGLELIIGKQPVVQKLGTTEAQNRFNLIFQKFMHLFASQEHPLTIFLDDLQWADAPSLKLLELFITNADSGYIFIVGAYRENEVGETHPLLLKINEMQKTGATIHTIRVHPLESRHVGQLIQETLHCNVEDAKSLTKLCFEKTQGNPFFLNQFLKMLYEENLIQFDWQAGNWQWDLVQIQARGMTDNVVELMLNKIQKTSSSTQNVMKLAACIGNHFDLLTLAMVNEKSLEETARDLWESLEENLVMPLDEAYKYVEEETEAVAAELLNGRASSASGLVPNYKFLHDRVQQAAYTLIAEVQKQELHLKIGRLILENTEEKEREEKIFDILNHLDAGMGSITDPAERENLAKLNLLAGKKAKASAAYEPAFDYLKKGLSLLSDDRWQTQYSLSLALYSEATEAAFLSHEFEEMEHLAQVVLKNANTLLEKMKVHEVKIQALMGKNQPIDAIQAALPVLRSLGVNFPSTPNNGHVLLGLIHTKLLLARRRPEDLLELPEMTDPHKLAATRILLSIVSSAYFSLPLLYPLIMFKFISLSLKYGNTGASAIGYAAYGVVLSGILIDVKGGNAFGQLALKLVERFEAKDLKPKVIQIVEGFITIWQESYRKVLPSFHEGYQVGLEVGDFEFGAYTLFMHGYLSFYIGENLQQVEAEMAKATHAIRQLNQTTPLYLQQIWHQVVLNLMGKSEHTCLLIGKAYNEKEMLPIHLGANDKSALFTLHLSKLIFCCLFHDYKESPALIKASSQYIEGALGSASVPLFYFLSSLASLSRDAHSKSDSKKRLKLVRKNQKKLKKWAFQSPMYCLHRYYLVEAELAHALGKDEIATKFYHQAVEEVLKNEDTFEGSLVCERVARFYQDKGQERIARVYLKDAHYAYSQWGATAKTDALEKGFPYLVSQGVPERFSSITSDTQTITSGESGSSQLDMVTVTKSAQAISEEIVLSQLLDKMIGIMIENAGAQKGVLLLEKKGEMIVEAEVQVEPSHEDVEQSEEITLSEKDPIESLPMTLIKYVARTCKEIILNDASHEGQFVNDPYVLAQQPKSLLCLPLMNQGKLSNILYLENNLATGAFTSDRVDVLRILSSQAVISIENARLYTSMEALNKSYARFVPYEFLNLLEKESILDVRLGDQTQKEMSVLFSDIRSFTTLSEAMIPQENFDFINSYLNKMEPHIMMHHGFIDKYIGDAIMAIFPEDADHALDSAIAMLYELKNYNEGRTRAGFQPINIGIGIHTGRLMLGIVGGANRMEGTVISDTVNLASRIEGMTKLYGASLLISGETLSQLKDSRLHFIRLVDRVRAKGKKEAVAIYEVYDTNAPQLRSAKFETAQRFEEGLTLYTKGELQDALKMFQECYKVNPNDQSLAVYLERCRHYLEIGIDENWDGIFERDSK